MARCGTGLGLIFGPRRLSPGLEARRGEFLEKLLLGSRFALAVFIREKLWLTGPGLTHKSLDSTTFQKSCLESVNFLIGPSK